MNDSWFLDDNLASLEDDFFEDIPSKNDGDDWIVKLETLELPPVNELFGLSERAVPCEKPLKRNPCSVPVDKGFHLQSEACEEKHSTRFQKSSPDSVLENPNSGFAENTEPNDPKFDVPAKRVRNKGSRRPRPNLNVFCVATSNKSSIGAKKKQKEKHIFTQPPLVTQEPEASTKRCLHCKITHTPLWRVEPLGPKTLCNACAMRFRSGRQETQPPPVSQEPVASTRKCTHCKITHTPQWREGPLGRKTLCNACGMRFRSGRLFPEYRPAASPTFVPSVHSNSHRKIIEMRTKSGYPETVVARETRTTQIT